MKKGGILEDITSTIFSIGVILTVLFIPIAIILSALDKSNWVIFIIIYLVISYQIENIVNAIARIFDFMIGSTEEDDPPILDVKDNKIMNKKLQKTNTPDIPTFNLSNLNLLDLSKELQRSLTSDSSSFIFMRERENKKLELQDDKVRIILQTIKDLNLTQQELTKFQADIFLSNELLEKIIASKREEINNIVELKKKEFLIQHKNLDVQHKALDDQLLQIDHGKRARELAIEAAEITNLRNRADLNLLTAQTNEAKAKAELIMFVVKELDLKNMPQTLQTYLISSIVNPQGSQYQDFDMQEQLKQFVIKEADAKARQSTAIASQAEHQTRIVEKTADKTVFDLESIRDSNKRS